MMDTKALRAWQLFKVDCEHREDRRYDGVWCKKYNVKCSYETCKEYDTHPNSSCGTHKNKKEVLYKKAERRTGLSKRQKEAYEHSEKGKSLSWIARKLNSKKTTVHSWINNYKAFLKANKGVSFRNDKGLGKKRNDKFLKRLHNDSVSFLIDPIDLSMVKNVVKLKYSSYLQDKRNNDWYIQIWCRKIVVRFLVDIEGKTEKICKGLADKRINNFLDVYEHQGVGFLNDVVTQVSRHYAIVGTDLAKKMVRENKIVVFRHRITGKVKGRIDDSHKILKEVDFEDPITGKDDSEKWSKILGDVASDDPIDLLSTTKKKTDLLLSDFLESKKMLQSYMEQISLHLKVEAKTNKVLDEMSRTLKDIRDSLKK